MKRSAVVTAIATLVFAGATCVPAAQATAPYAPKLPPLVTRWTDSVSTVSPLPDYPRPELQRARWLSLNGRWQYERAYLGQTPPFGKSLSETILVPFPVQSALSGIERHDLWGWYRRTFAVPSGWGAQHVLLNFGAVSWEARVWVNGILVGTHRGDYDGFSFDITSALRRGAANELLVEYINPLGSAGEPVGKQTALGAYGIHHTAVSGIWQTVWLEPVDPDHLTALRLTPDVRRHELIVSVAATGAGDVQVRAQALAGLRLVATGQGRPGRPLVLALAHPRLWSPSDPYLYGLHVQLVRRGAVLDRVRSYFGMRSISLGYSGGAVRLLLNDQFVFETGALDQGYWPDGLYTAPTDAALRFDIQAAKQLGYNMLREHVKVQPDRWYYWADRLGILVWQDMPNMGLATHYALTRPGEAEFLRELNAIIAQRAAHPSIVTWVPFNEGWQPFAVTGVTRLIRRLDPTRLIDSESGSANCCKAAESPVTDIRDTHLYFGPFAVAADYRASAIGEYGGVLPFAPPSHRWPGVQTSIGSPASSWKLSYVTGLLRVQYADIAQEMRTRGLSAAVFTELGACEQELGIISYDRDVFTIPPNLLRGLNNSLIAASEQSSQLRPQAATLPTGATGLWTFDEAQGTRARDGSGQRRPLTLAGGASWTSGMHGSALAITGPGQQAVARWPVVDTRRSFTLAAWLRSDRPAQSGSAISEPGPDGSAFSLGIETASLHTSADPGEAAIGTPRPSQRTWWTFVVPFSSTCPSARCGVQANMHFDDGRYSPAVGAWHYVTGVFDRPAHTISVYVDGVPEDVEHVVAVPPAHGPLTVGAGLLDYSPSDVFIGAIDDLRTYGRALSAAEVWELYAAER